MRRKGFIKDFTRADDERHLKWLRWRCDGYTSRQIGEAEGYSQEHVRTATNRIKEADICSSPISEESEIRRAYW